jgi:arsenate reductase (glutaredoxin)
MHGPSHMKDESVKKVTFYHNPRCSKSRKALELLREREVEPEIVEYLQSPPSLSELDRILKLLDMEPRALMRKQESIYKDLALGDESLDRHSLLQAMIEHPILIERPIAVGDGRAALGRPPENVLDVI